MEDVFKVLGGSTLPAVTRTVAFLMMSALRIESIVLDDIKECAARFQAGPDDGERPNGSGLHLSSSTLLWEEEL